DELLERQLVEAMGDAGLEGEDADAVRERFGRGMVGGGTRELVGQGKTEPDRHLATEVSPTPRQNAPPSCNHRRHGAGLYKTEASEKSPRDPRDRRPRGRVRPLRSCRAATPASAR